MASRFEEDDVHLGHAELHHYTRWEGLKGVVETNTLWATYYKNLNDYSEVEHLKSYLLSCVAERLRETLKKFRGNSLKRRTKISKGGGSHVVAKEFAAQAIDIAYRATYLGVTKPTIPFASPFIFSFCSHVNDDQYVQKNGLLSQWRSYAAGEGFAIVFDSSQVQELLRKESDAYDYTFLNWCDVVYDESFDAFKQRFSRLIEMMHDLAWIQGTENRMPGDTGDFIKEFLVSSCSFKHRAFKEEREVRIISCPMSNDLRKKIVRDHGTYEKLHEPVKPSYLRGADNSIPFVKLFDFKKKARLPIKRIIVGPHREQSVLKMKVQALVKDRFPVVCSETPLR